MKKLSITLLCFGLFSCSKPPTPLTIHEQESSSKVLKEAFNNTAEAYFKLGMQLTIRAHLEYVQKELLANRKPEASGLPVREWESEVMKRRTEIEK